MLRKNKTILGTMGAIAAIATIAIPVGVVLTSNKQVTRTDLSSPKLMTNED